MKRLLTSALPVLLLFGCSNQPSTSSAPGTTVTQASDSAKPVRPKVEPVPTTKATSEESKLETVEPKEESKEQPIPEPTIDELLLQASASLLDKNYSAAIETLKNVLSKDPDNRKGLWAITQATENSGIAILQPGADGARGVTDPDEIEKGYSLFLDAARHLRTLKEKYPDSNDLEKQLSINVLYNEACALAVTKKDKPNAIKSLQASVMAGFTNSKLLSQDPDLDLIRDMPEFKEIAEKLKPKEEPEPKENSPNKSTGESKDSSSKKDAEPKSEPRESKEDSPPKGEKRE